MTVGSKSYDLGSHTVQVTYWDARWNPTNQGTSLISRTFTKTWSGNDRIRITLPRPRHNGVKRWYSYIEYKKVKGKLIGFGKTRTYWTRPISERVAKSTDNEPHPYQADISLRLDENFDLYYHGSLYMNYVEEASATRFSCWPYYATMLPLSANDQIRLVNKLKSKMRGSDFNLAVFLGEGHQTIEMIAKSALKLAQAGLAARKGNFQKAKAALLEGRPSLSKKHSSHASNTWLELQYGWLPLLSDIKEGAEQLAHILAAPSTNRYSARIRIKGPFVPKNFEWQWREAYQSRSRQIIAYVTHPQSLIETSGLMDPELVLWELLPFSFVADWVIPIGPYLEARAFARKLTGTFVQTEIYREYSRVLVQQVRNDGVVVEVLSNDVLNDLKKISRTVSTELAVPLPEVKTLEKVASWQHMANALALVTQVFSGPLKRAERDVAKQTKVLTSFDWGVSGKRGNA